MKKYPLVIGFTKLDCMHITCDADPYFLARIRFKSEIKPSLRLRYGDFDNELFEYMVNCPAGDLVGLTLVSFLMRHDSSRAPQGLPVIEGLPVVKIEDDPVGPSYAPRIDVSQRFSVFVEDGAVEIDFGEIHLSDSILSAECVSFYLRNSFIVGLRVVRQ